MIPDLHAGTIDGVDSFGVERDINSLASLIASLTVAPPLSIGVFGRAGEGKTFFIDGLANRVTQLTTASPADGDQGYCRNVVQVHYNASHNAGSSPWIALVEAVLTALDVSTTG